MNLEFFKTYVKDGIKTYLAHPTADFWRQWRESKYELLEQGITVEQFEGRWLVKQKVKVHENKPFTPPAPYTAKDTRKLLDYQIVPSAQLTATILSQRIGIDLSDTGTGKTYVALHVCAELQLRPCVLCPLNAIYMWKQVCKYFNLNPLFIINWESSRGKIYKKNKRIHHITQPVNKFVKMGLDEWTGHPVYKWTIPLNANVLFIFDEAHKANGSNSHNQKLMYAARKYRCILASATLADSLAKFRGVGAMLGLFNYDDFSDWMRDRGMVKNKHNQWQTIKGTEDMRNMSKILFPKYGVRIRKSEVKGFPDVQNIARCFPIAKAELQNKRYDTLLVKIKKLKEEKKYNEALVLQLRYRQLSELYKIELLTSLANDYIDSGMSVVIFVNFKESLTRLAKSLKTKCIIYGGQDAMERINNIAAFQDDRERVILGNIQAGGVSISLHDLKGKHPRICIIPPTYDPVQLIQAMGRIHRAGALSKAINMLVYAAGTVEEKRVFPKVSEKIDCVNALNDGDLAETDVFERE